MYLILLAVASSLHFIGTNNNIHLVNNAGGCAVAGAGGAMYTTILYLNNNFINKSAGFVDAISIFHSIGVLTFNGT